MVVAVDEDFEGGALGQEVVVIECLVEHGLDFAVDVRVVLLDAVVGRDTHLAVVRSQGNDLNVAVAEFLGESLAYGLRLGILLEGHDEVASAGEVDALAQSADGERSDADGDEDAEDGEVAFHVSHEVILRVDHQVLGEPCGERQVQPLVLVHVVLVHQTGEEHGGEEGAGNTDDEGRGEAADGARTEEEQDDTGDDGGQVGVEDRGEGVLVTVLQGALDVLAQAQFLLRTFVDQHVGVDCHTEGEHHTRDTAHGQCCLEGREDAQGEEEVKDECHVGYHARDEAVHGAHVYHQKDEGDDEGDDALVDGLLSE